MVKHWNGAINMSFRKARSRENQIFGSDLQELKVVCNTYAIRPIGKLPH
jgi:hypothetical protein